MGTYLFPYICIHFLYQREHQETSLVATPPELAAGVAGLPLVSARSLQLQPELLGGRWTSQADSQKLLILRALKGRESQT